MHMQVALKEELRRRFLPYSNKAVLREGRNGLKQSQLQIDRLENQVQELKKKLEIERSQVCISVSCAYATLQACMYSLCKPYYVILARE